jgi:hypothetical protein
MFRKTVLTAACLCLPIFAWSGPKSWDDGDAIPENHGVLVFKVERERLRTTGAKRGAFTLTLHRVGSDEKIVISNPTRLRAYLLPAGSYYLGTVRDIESASESRGVSNASRAFDVKAGQVSWGGVWRIAVGAESTQLAVSHPAEDESELREEFAKAFAAGQLLKAHEGGSTESYASN